MRVTARRGMRGALMILALVAACERHSPVPRPSTTPTAVAATTGAASRNVVMGTGEPREPEPFTLEQRLLDAVRRGDRATVERALARGASIQAKDDIGRGTALLAVLDAGDLDLLRWLQAKGAALDEPDSGGRTALSFAAALGRLDIVRYLVEHDAVVDRRDIQQRTALFHATLNDRRTVVDFLLDRGADVNARDQFHDTPLIAACAKGYNEMAALVLRRGADPALTDQEGRTARERAAGGTAACLTAGPR